MAITFAGGYTDDYKRLFTSSFSMVYVPQGGIDNLVVFGLALFPEFCDGVSAVTYRGVAATPASDFTSTRTLMNRLFWATAGAGTGTFRGKIQGTGRFMIHGAEFSGVDMASPVGAWAGNDGFSGSAIAMQVDVSADGMALMFASSKAKELGEPSGVEGSQSTSIVRQQTASAGLPPKSLAFANKFADASGSQTLHIVQLSTLADFVAVGIAIRPEEATGGIDISPADTGLARCIGSGVETTATLYLDASPESGRLAALGSAIDTSLITYTDVPAESGRRDLAGGAVDTNVFGTISGSGGLRVVLGGESALQAYKAKPAASGAAYLVGGAVTTVPTIATDTDIVFVGSYAVPDVYTDATASFSFKYVPQGGAENLLLLGLTTGNHGNPTGVTYRGIAADLVVSASTTVGAMQQSVFRAEVGAGTGTFRGEFELTASAAPTVVWVDGLEFSGIDRANPTGSIQNQYGSGTGPGTFSASVSMSVEGEVAFMWIVSNKQHTGTPAAVSATSSTSVIYQRTAEVAQASTNPRAVLVANKYFNSAGAQNLIIRNELSNGIWASAAFVLRPAPGAYITAASGRKDLKGGVPTTIQGEGYPAAAGAANRIGGAVQTISRAYGSPASGLLALAGNAVTTGGPVESGYTGVVTISGGMPTTGSQWTDEAPSAGTTWVEPDYTVYP